MNSQRWQQVKQIFQQAVELDAPLRQNFLDASCGTDTELKLEIESLLSFEASAQNFIEESAFDVAAKCITQSEALSFLGKDIGSYKILRELGRGGMGAVYLAERFGLFDRQVAIKVIKHGMDTDAIIKRFAMERQILANLDHSNIAHLLDGGMTEDGLSYFVMEFIEGKTINKFCDDEQFTITERLQIFRKVCSAVSYAHKNLVVHRDIKPSNVLVNKEGEPKLLDFGIAKLIQSPDSGATETFFTQADLQAFTPEYASPEQIRGERITTSTDVYSLGVLLYELLTGSRPYRFKSLTSQDVVEAVCMIEPEKPSSVVSGQWSVKTKAKDLKTIRQSAIGNRQLKGDLDTIILTALRKEPERRYSSVEQFSEDIRRYLEGLPVMARSDSLKYRTAKFIRRNALAVSAAALIFVSMFAGIITTTWQARRAEQQRVRAEKRFNDVRRLANALVNEYHTEAEKLAGATTLRQMMMRDAVQYLDALAVDAGNEPALEKELASAYLKIGDVQGRPFAANSGDTKSALESYGKAEQIIQSLLRREPENRQLQLELSRAFEGIGGIQMREFEVDASIESHKKALLIRENLSNENPSDINLRRFLSGSLLNLGDAVAVKSGLLRDEVYERQFEPLVLNSLEHFRRSLEIRKGIAAETKTTDSYLDVSTSLQRVAFRLETLGDYKKDQTFFREALATHEEALRLLQEAQKIEPDNGKARRNRADQMMVTADVRVKLGDYKTAMRYYRQSLAIFEKIVLVDPLNLEAKRDLANLYDRLGRYHYAMEKPDEAIQNYQKAADILEVIVRENPTRSDETQLKSMRWWAANLRERIRLHLH